MPYVISPDPEFTGQIDKIVEASTAADAASTLDGQRMWMYPPLSTWDGDPQNITGMNAAFSRDNLNSLYRQINGDVTRSGTVGESMVVKLQVDYIAALERGFRTRHCSSVRAKLHAAARRRGHGSPNGVFNGHVVPWLERLIFAAHDDPFANTVPGEEPNA